MAHLLIFQFSHKQPSLFLFCTKIWQMTWVHVLSLVGGFKWLVCVCCSNNDFKEDISHSLVWDNFYYCILVYMVWYFNLDKACDLWFTMEDVYICYPPNISASGFTEVKACIIFVCLALISENNLCCCKLLYQLACLPYMSTAETTLWKFNLLRCYLD